MGRYEPKLPLQYRVEALALTKDTEALRLTKRWLCAPRKDWALVMLGGHGCGKSQAATLAWMVTPGAIWLRARRLQSMQWEARDELIELAEHAPLTVVDEILSENEAGTDTVCEIVETRGEAFERTILLGNGKLEAFDAKYNGRMLSRLGVSPEWLCEVQGEDLRQIIDPIVERPAMPWIPAGLTDHERADFRRVAFVDGLEAARAAHAKRSGATDQGDDRSAMIDRVRAELAEKLGKRECDLEKASAENREADERRRRERERGGLLDTLDYVASETGREPEALLAEIGRTQRTLERGDRDRLLAMLKGKAS